MATVLAITCIKTGNEKLIPAAIPMGILLDFAILYNLFGG